jgi:hypothetical protein
MRLGRVVGIAATAALAAGSCLLAGNSAGSAATPPPPTPISLGALGMSSSACPLPLNGSMAVKPGTTVQFKPDALGALETLTLSYVRETTSTPKPAPTTKSPVPSAGWPVAFNSAGTYDLSWHIDILNILGGIASVGATQIGKLLVSTNAQQCVIAVQVPVPSASVPVPGPVNSIVNGVVSSAVSAVNGVLSPVNSVVGPPLGTVGGVVGGVTGGLTGGVPGAGVPPGGSDPGTIYKPTGPTVAQRTVPQGYGSGNGAAGLYLPGNSGSINAPAIGFTGTGKSSANSAPIKSGGSPHTVDLASDKPRSALEGWSALIVVVALVALSGATAFYARTFLLQPAPATS